MLRMQRLVKGVLILNIFGFGLGCASLQAPVTGLLYNNQQYAVAVTDREAGTRVGEACVASYLSLVAVGDGTIEAARREGGINTVSSVDRTFLSYGPFYSKSCTIVRGK